MRLSIVMVATLACSPVLAAEHPLSISDGNELHAECLDAQRVMRAAGTAPNWPIEVSMNAASCVSFLSAINQLVGRLIQTGVLSTPLCTMNAHTDQLVDGFLNYSNANPQFRNRIGADFAVAALVSAFKCDKTDWPRLP